MLPTGLDLFSIPQPQVSQIECLFTGPLVKGSMVQSLNDLITLDITYHYEHKIVWVKDTKTNYYLDNGTGTEISDWRPISTRLVLERYQPDSAYGKGEMVYLSNKLYVALENISIDTYPTASESWLLLNGDSSYTSRHLFQNTSSVLIYTDIRNPRFEIILGTFKLDNQGNQIFNSVTGLAELENKHIVDAPIMQREDLSSDENGIPYEIAFYENSELTIQLSGCINIK